MLAEPSLFRAVLLKVPFVDVLTSMLDSSLPLTVHEYDEWGNPHQEEVYKYIAAYDPYRRLWGADVHETVAALPALYVTASTLDTRVPYWQPAKFVARLRHLRASAPARFRRRGGPNPLLLRVDDSTGHFGEGGRYERFRHIVEEYSFLFSCVGIDK